MKSDHELELDGAFNSLKAFSSYKYNHLTFYIEDLYHIFNTRPEYNQQDFIRILNESDRSNKYNAEIPAAYKLAVVNYFWDVFSNILFERIFC